MRSAKGWSTRSLAAALGLSVALLAGRASAQEYLCGGPILKSHAFGYTTATYIVAWRCEAYSGKNHHVQEVTFYGTWDRAASLATEQVADRYLYYYDGAQSNDVTYQKKVTATCPDDPWLNDVTCYGYQVDPVNPTLAGVPTRAPNPKGAWLLVSSGLSPALLAEYRARLEAPKIIAPAEGASFTYPGNIPIKVQHNTQFGLDFYVGWRPDAQHAITQVSNSIIFGLQAGNGETTGQLNLIKPGQWTIRARLNTDAKAWWSDPHFFKAVGTTGSPILVPEAVKLKGNLSQIQFPQLAPGPVTIVAPQPGAVFADDVKVRVQPPPQPATTKVKLAFEKKSGANWVAKDVVPGYDTADKPTGIKIPRAKFGAGTWRVKAAQDAANAPWAGPVKFEIP